MALINTDSYTFNSRQAVLDFIAPLITEGYPVAIQTVYGNTIMDKDKIDHFEVFIGEKRKPIKIFIQTDESEEPKIESVIERDPVPYEILLAFEQGKTLEYRSHKWSAEEPGENEWKPFSKYTACIDYTFDTNNYEYRIKEE